MAHYEYADGYIRTLDFTENASVNFEPASAFMGEDEDYSRNFAEFLQNNAQAKEMLAQLDISEITEQMILNCMQQIPIKVDRDFVVEFILNGQRKMRLLQNL